MAFKKLTSRAFFIGWALLWLIVFNPATNAHRASPPRSVFQDQTLSISLETVVTGLNNPVYITHSRDESGRLFIVEQPGRIRILQNGKLLSPAFLDLSSKVLFGGERGLLGLAFHPKFATNRRFFVNYTRQPDGATIIAEYTVSSTNSNLADTSERVLLTIPQPFVNHNGGMIEFGPDGYLYIGMGDGGSAGDPQNNGQNLMVLLGKMLRIDVDGETPYAIPKDNPFFGALSIRNEIYAYGLRNPWRFSFDRETGELYAGDVGQNRIEEVDIIKKGGNYGWRLMEGSSCYNPATNCDRTGLILPITEYDHTIGCSITGGYVYRGKRFPDLQGVYFFGDYCQGTIFSYRNGTTTKLLQSGLGITSFGEDQDGELYVIGQKGTIAHILGPTPSGNCTLTCPQNITVTDTDGNGSEVVTYSAPIEKGLCGAITSTPPSGSTFPVGTTTVNCVASMGGGACSFTITVNPKSGGDQTPPTVRVIAPNGKETLRAGQPFTIEWQSSDNVGVINHDISLFAEFLDIAPKIVATGLSGTAQSFLWTVDAYPSPARIQVTAKDAAGNVGSDVSDAPFIIQVPDTQAPTVKITSPNGGEKLKAGSSFTITWQSSDNVGIKSQNILLSTDGGATFPTTLVSDLPGAAQSFMFAVPSTQAKSKTARVRVVAFDAAGNQGQDESDANFKIKPKR